MTTLGLKLKATRWQHRQTPAQLRAVIARISPDVLLWLGTSQIRDANLKVTSWPCSNGNHTLAPYGTGKFDTTVERGRLGSNTTLLTSTTDGYALTNASVPAPKHLFLLTKPSANLTGNKQAIATGTANDGLVRLGGGTVWYASGWTQYRNGGASTDAPAGVTACFEAEKSANANAGLTVGGYNAALNSYVWDGVILAVAVATSVLTRAQANAISTALLNWVER